MRRGLKVLRRSFRRFSDYTGYIKTILEEFSDIIAGETVEVFEAVPSEGFIRGTIMFIDGSTLSFLEYVKIKGNKPVKIKYRYNYTDENSRLIFRYDNAPHHREIKTYPHHKHIPNNKVEPTTEPNLKTILEEITTQVK